jgi:hypothetical protein
MMAQDWPASYGITPPCHWGVPTANKAGIWAETRYVLP